MPESDLVSSIVNKIKLAPYLSQSYKKRLINSLYLENIKERKISELSGGELQRVAIADCLSTEADIYLLDEPSAFLDIEMRLTVAQLLRKSIEELKKSAFIVEHDIITQDFIADSILVFEGTPGIEGKALAPLNLRDGFSDIIIQGILCSVIFVISWQFFCLVLSLTLRLRLEQQHVIIFFAFSSSLVLLEFAHFRLGRHS